MSPRTNDGTIKINIMLKEIKTRPVITPQPVLIVGTYDEKGTPDAMSVAWGGQCWDKKIALNISKGHKTTENIEREQCFTLHMGDLDRVALCDYFGIVSGKKVDKFAEAKVAYTKGSVVNAPIIEDFLLAMECKVVSITDNGDAGVRIVGEVVRTVADDTILTEDGKVAYERLQPIVFDSERNTYRTVGGNVADAFLVGKTLFGE